MRIIVIGGAGFIGSNFCQLIQKERPDWKLWVLDKYTYASNRDNLPKGILENYFDISKENSIKLFNEAFIGDIPDLIINFAAETHVDNSIENASEFVKTNINGVYNILQVCKDNNIRFIQISTDEVLGDLPLDSKEKFTKESPMKPNNPYAATKASAEHLVNSYIRTFGLNANITRCTNNYGKYQHIEKLIPKSITNLMDDKQIPIYGKGNNIRDWIHVEDHCRGILAVIEKGVSGETYMFGGNNEISNLELAETLCKLMDKDPKKYIKFVDNRLGHDLRYAIENETDLDWKPIRSFEDGIKETINWYKNNK